MNVYIKAQCQNMLTTVEIFEAACALAAKKDDGSISKEEAKTIKRIRNAAQAFKTELRRVN